MIVRMAHSTDPIRRPMRRAFAGLGLAVFIALGVSDPTSAQTRARGIDNLPALGEASVDELSPAAEQRLGDQIFQEFLRVGVVWDDPETTDVIAQQAMRLLRAAGALGHAESDRPFRFFLVRDSSINAFALPGGYIGIHTGLITASDREAEVMSVLAHEIGHVTQRHIARMFGQQRQSSAVMIAAAVLAAMAAKSSPDAAMGMISLGQTVALRDQLAFSRDAEREADRVGLQILTESGFDPQSMSAMFERLSQAGRLYDNNAPAYLRTHPLTTERIADIQSRLQSDPGVRQAARDAVKTNSVAYDWLRAKLLALADTKVDGLRSARQRFEAQLTDPAMALAKDGGARAQAAVHFGLSWAALTQRDPARALTHHRQATELSQRLGVETSVAPLLDHLRLRIAMTTNDSLEQERLAMRVSAAHPQSRAVHRAAVEARLAVGSDLESTAQMARTITQQWPWDPQAWAILGRAEAARGRRTAQHAAVAEQYALSGAYAAAVEQLTLARAAGDADFMTLSKIDARLTTMRAMLRREQLERAKSP